MTHMNPLKIILMSMASYSQYETKENVMIVIETKKRQQSYDTSILF